MEQEPKHMFIDEVEPHFACSVPLVGALTLSLLAVQSDGTETCPN